MLTVCDPTGGDGSSARSTTFAYNGDGQMVMRTTPAEIETFYVGK